MQSLIGSANRSGVSIYAVDLSALDQESNAMAASLAMARSGGAGQSGIAAPAPTGPVGPSLPGGEITMASEQGSRIENGAADVNQSPLADLCLRTAGAYIPAGGGMRELCAAWWPISPLITKHSTFRPSLITTAAFAKLESQQLGAA